MPKNMTSVRKTKQHKVNKQYKLTIKNNYDDIKE